MSEARRCPQCGTPIPEDAPEGLCPNCVLKAGMQSGADSLAGITATAGNANASFVPPSPEELAPRFPDLEILQFIGRGGMGIVYKARQKHLDRLVALKILLPAIATDAAFAERFAREARAMAMLSHPHIVAVYDFGQRGDLFYFLMEFVDGPTLRQVLDASKLTPPEALAIVPQICEALQFAHDRGVVHRDIKPENILLDKQGRVKIADFGLAKLVGQPATDFSITGTGQVMGTPHYMAPEQFEHPQDVDHRADIYSLGVVFYQMLTGELPLGRFAPPSCKVQVDVRLDEVVLRALEKEPERRYQQASDVKTEVETIAAAPPPAQRSFAAGQDRPPVTPPQSIRPLPDARLSRAAIVGAVWAAIGLIGMLLLFTV
jgi:eukaryotic-like serine/threonine-protein kinase